MNTDLNIRIMVVHELVAGAVVPLLATQKMGNMRVSRKKRRGLHYGWVGGGTTFASIPMLGRSRKFFQF